MPDVIFGDLARWRGPRPDDAHLPAQHIPQLWQLIDARLAEERPKPGDARIGGHLERGTLSVRHGDDLGVARLRIGDHRPELDDRERATLEPDAHLAEEDRPALG